MRLMSADIRCFNPRTHEECDFGRHSTCSRVNLFQSTHSRGVRLSGSLNQMGAGAVSIHALTRSATADDGRTKRKRTVSIHALTRSATSIVGVKAPKISVSIHALTRSATRRSAHTQTGSKRFNPRTHEECDKQLVSLETLK